MNDAYNLQKNLFGRWYIVHPQDEFKAWTGSRWVSHYKGMPAQDVQICNFSTPSELHRYALSILEQLKNTPITAEK